MSQRRINWLAVIALTLLTVVAFFAGVAITDIVLMARQVWP